MSSFQPRGIVVHVSASTFGDAKRIREWHTAPPPRGRGWSDIGYHGVILNGFRASGKPYDADLDGIFEVGRARIRQGAHCSARSMNKIALGICVVGLPDARALPVGPEYLSASLDPAACRVAARRYITRQQHRGLVAKLAEWCRVLGEDPQGTFPWHGRLVPTITQHSDHDAGKPLCASLHMEIIRRQVSEAMR